jgi:LmbE family N-acetylglucosaminyl deacetylase
MLSDIFNSNNNGKLLIIMAHPDDETINCGGILAKAASKKIDTYALCLTLGGLGVKTPEAPRAQLEQIRKFELQRAASILNIKKLYLPRLPDGKLFLLRSHTKQVIRKTMRMINPSIVITHDPTGKSGHPDHVTISMCVTEIFFSKIFKNTDYYYVLSSQSKTRRGIRATHAINIIPNLTAKIRALNVYQSQIIQTSVSKRSTVNWNSIDTEWFHMLHNKSYSFHIRQFQTNKGILLPGVNKKYILS